MSNMLSKTGKKSLISIFTTFAVFILMLLFSKSSVFAIDVRVEDWTYKIGTNSATFDCDALRGYSTNKCGYGGSFYTGRCQCTSLNIASGVSQNGWYNNAVLYFREKLEQDGGRPQTNARPYWMTDAFKISIGDYWLVGWGGPLGWWYSDDVIGVYNGLWAYRRGVTYNSFWNGTYWYIPVGGHETYGNSPFFTPGEGYDVKHWGHFRKKTDSCHAGPLGYNACRYNGGLYAMNWGGWIGYVGAPCYYYGGDCVSPVLIEDIGVYKRINVDRTPPTATDLNIGSDSTWKTYAGATLTAALYDQTHLSGAGNIYIRRGGPGGVVISSSGAWGNGWSHVAAGGAPISEGTHTYCVTGNDRAGNQASAKCSTLSKDSRPPFVNVTTPSVTKINSITTNIAFNGADDTSLTPQVSGIGGAQIELPAGITTVYGSGVINRNETISLNDGSGVNKGKYTVRVRTFDNSTPRNFSGWQSVEYWVDMNAPDALTDSDVNVSFDNKILTITWNDKLDNGTGPSAIKNRDEVVPGASNNYTSGVAHYIVRYSKAGGPFVNVVVDKNVRSFSIDNSDRDNLSVEIFAVDNVGNQATPWKDTQAPTITMGGISENSVENLPDTLQSGPITISVSDNILADGGQFYWTANVSEPCNFVSDNVRMFKGGEVGSTSIPSIGANKLCIRAYDVFGNFTDKSSIYFRSEADNKPPVVHIDGLKQSKEEMLPYTLSNGPITVYTTDDNTPDGGQLYWSEPEKDCEFTNDSKRDYLGANKITLTVPNVGLNKLCVRGYDTSNNKTDEVAFYFLNIAEVSQDNPMDDPNNLELKINIIQKQKTLELIDRVVKERN